MEIVIDPTTRERLGDALTVEPMPELKLKGFSAPVRAYKVLAPHVATSAAAEETGASRTQ